ncbi:hypothetical protein MJM04_31240, partial [Salmonella enterica subsp. enterica serovar Cerro]|nr:hypothetical protein [Salmonella enterica subsp. enterica serovar Cerro]
RAALKQRPDAYDYAWLADALDRLHQPEEAAAMRRDGLMLTLHLAVFSNYILSAQKTKGLPFGNPLFNLAEAQRFELWNPFGSPV